MIGQVVLNHGIGMIQQVGHTHHFDRLFHVRVKIIAGFVEIHHVQNGSTDHSLYVFSVNVERSFESCFGAIHLFVFSRNQGKGEQEKKKSKNEDRIMSE